MDPIKDRYRVPPEQFAELSNQMELDKVMNLLRGALIIAERVNEGTYRSRQLSLAITNIEQAEMWLGRAVTAQAAK